MFTLNLNQGIFDIRQRQMRHTFQAHESLIRCLAMDPEEEYFVTGSADGDVKVVFFILPYNLYGILFLLEFILCPH